ncbi:hypothetical protein TSAR_016624 [Trichomalopsis sarcophagae]|uniref:Uncharacterized protein n=1 Tax=Trichomalopsis sarcophagae TaxID=543379 RepID=A0A232FE03_9HYME|nr:hypothetical protein TSAR_016624 [Trichomalopsis sarcophagae]
MELGFKGVKGDFVLKELAYIDPYEEFPVPKVALFKPPYDWSLLPSKSKSENLYLQHYFHGLNWSDGIISYDKIDAVVQKIKELAEGNSIIILVKGKQKIKWLQPYFKEIKNLEDAGCPFLRSDRFRRLIVCKYHPGGWQNNCAVQNVQAIQRWIARLVQISHLVTDTLRPSSHHRQILQLTKIKQYFVLISFFNTDFNYFSMFSGTMDLINLADKTPSFLPTRRIRDLKHNKMKNEITKMK